MTNHLDADNTQIVVCMICDERFDSVMDPHFSTAHEAAPAAAITAPAAYIFAALLAAEDAVADARTAIAFAPAMTPDQAVAALHARLTDARKASVAAFDAGFAAVGRDMEQFGAYRQVATYAQTITMGMDE